MPHPLPLLLSLACSLLISEELYAYCQTWRRRHPAGLQAPLPPQDRSPPAGRLRTLLRALQADLAALKAPVPVERLWTGTLTPADRYHLEFQQRWQERIASPAARPAPPAPPCADT